MFPFITLLHQRKKKGVFCFSSIQQFRSKASILEIIICNIRYEVLHLTALFCGLSCWRGIKHRNRWCSPDIYFPPVRDPMWKRQEMVLQTSWITKHLFLHPTHFSSGLLWCSYTKAPVIKCRQLEACLRTRKQHLQYSWGENYSLIPQGFQK